MKNLILIILCTFSTGIISQQSLISAIPNNQLITDSYTKPDSLDLYFSFPCIAFEGEYGIEGNGEDIYVSQYSGDSIAKYDRMGSVLEEFVIEGAGNIRDMAYDGEFCYGGSIDSFLCVMDMEIRNLVAKVHMPFAIQGMAYDYDNWLCYATEEGSSEINKLDFTGVIINSWIPEGANPVNITGLAYDYLYYNKGPYLWALCNDNAENFIVKYDIETQSQIGNIINISCLVAEDAMSGGLCIQRINNYYEFMLVGIIQDQLVFALDLNYVNLLVDSEENIMLKKFDVYPNPAKDKICISTSYHNNQKIICRIINQSGSVLYENSLSSDDLFINISEFKRGTYFVQLIGADGYSFTKKFIK